MTPPVPSKTEQTAIALARRIVRQTPPPMVKLTVSSEAPSVAYDDRWGQIVVRLRENPALHAQIVDPRASVAKSSATQPTRTANVKNWFVARGISSTRLSEYSAIADANVMEAKANSEELIQILPQVWVRLLEPTASALRTAQQTAQQTAPAQPVIKKPLLEKPQPKVTVAAAPVVRKAASSKVVQRKATPRAAPRVARSASGSKVARKAPRRPKPELWMLK